MCRILATEVHRRLISDCNGRDPRSGAVLPLRRFGIALVPRLPVLGGFPAATPRFAPPCAGADCGDPPFRRRPPRFWVVLQENGPEFDALPGFWAVISVPRRDSRRWLRYNPRSEAFTSSVPRSAAYETAQNFAQALANARVPLHAAGLRNRPGLCLAFQATNQTVGRAACETVENLARALCRTSDRAKNGEMGIRNRPELHSGVRPPSAG